jgi:micrococcal nuclease
MLLRVTATLTAATLVVACQSVAPPLVTTPLPPTLAPVATLPAASTQPVTTAPVSASSPLVGLAPGGSVQLATVSKVTDGDTIHVNIDGTDYSLRYIGMDAPETVDPNKPVQPGGHEAAAANQALVEGQQVYLEKDVSETDRFGRLLRYVWLKNGTGWLMVDRELVREGWARAKAYPPDTKYQQILDEAQAEAQAAHVGLWAPGFPTPGPTTRAVPFVGGAGGCDPAYPTVCIPPPPPDLDCADIPYRRFTVVPPDPHNFDGDHNRIGCEHVAGP